MVLLLLHLNLLHHLVVKVLLTTLEKDVKVLIDISLKQLTVHVLLIPEPNALAKRLCLLVVYVLIDTFLLIKLLSCDIPKSEL